MTIINIDFSPAAKQVKQQLISDQLYAEWKSHKRLELITRDSMDNLEELSMQMALQASMNYFQEVQILPPEQASQDKPIHPIPPILNSA